MKNKSTDVSGDVAQILNRNIRALLELKKKEDQELSKEEKVVAAITRFTGSMAFVYIHMVFFGFFIIWNLGWLPLTPFDPTFVSVALFASVEAIFLSTFVLISQNRMFLHSDKRSDLDLQISLLAEHEITHLIHLVSAIAKKMDIEGAQHPELEELKQKVRPEKIMDTMEMHKEKIIKKV